MSTNCLVTKLKASVDNDNLLKVGEMVLHKRAINDDGIPFTGNTSLYFATAIDAKIINNVGNVHFVGSQGEDLGTEITGVSLFKTSAGECDIVISNKYNIVNIARDSGNRREFGIKSNFDYMCSALNKPCILKNIDGDVSFIETVIKDKQSFELRLTWDLYPLAVDINSYFQEIIRIGGASKLTNIIITANPSTTPVALASLSPFYNLESLSATLSSNISGTFADLGQLTQLSNIVIDFSTFSGSIESFVTAQRTAGRTTCQEVKFSLYTATGVTFNGNALTPGFSNKILSWTSDTITFDGVTINA